jgi:hypothetical protein
MPTEYALADLPTIRARINVQARNNDFDPALVMFSRIATQMIEAQIGLTLLAADHVEVRDTFKNYSFALNLVGGSYGGQVDNYQVQPVRLRLKGSPLSVADGVEVRYDPLDRAFAAGSVIDPAYYTVDYQTGTLVLETPVDTRPRALRIAYSAGYPLDYETVPDADTARVGALEEDVDALSTLVIPTTSDDAIARLVDGTVDKVAAQAATKAAATAYVQYTFPGLAYVAGASWYAPSDVTPVGDAGGDMTTAALTLQGSVLGDFTDTVTIATQDYTGVQDGHELRIDAGRHATGYKAFRLVCAGTNATVIRCAQVVWRWKDPERAFLRDVPASLAGACALLTKYLWSKDRGGGIGMAGAVERRNTAFQNPGAIPAEILGMIGPYRRTRM